MTGNGDTVFSPVSPQEALHHSPSAREKEVDESHVGAGEHAPFSPVSPLAAKNAPITNYNDNPQEAPQALNAEANPVTGEKDNAANAPEVLEVDRSPPYIVSFQHNTNESPSTAAPAYTPTSPHAQTGDEPRTSSLPSLSAVESGDAAALKETPPPPPRILGLKKRTFWVLLALVLLLIVGAAIGGGVGGAMANRNKSNNKPENSDTIIPLAPDEPTITGWNLTVYSSRNFTGERRVLDTIGLFNTYFTANVSASDPAVLLDDPFGDGTYNSTISNSYAWRSGESGCCVKFCMRNVDIGYKCRSETANPNVSFDKVALACGGEPDTSVCQREGS